MINNNARKIILVLGDFFVLMVGLWITLILRYGQLPSLEKLAQHFSFFSWLYFGWLIIFFISGLYEIEKLSNTKNLSVRLAKNIAISSAFSVLVFYFLPQPSITPRTILVINGLVSLILIFIWRISFLKILTDSQKIPVYFRHNAKEIDDLITYINQNPQLGYNPQKNISATTSKNYSIFVITEEDKQNSVFIEQLYSNLGKNMEVVDFDKFYEKVTGKIPVSIINKAWFLENFFGKKKVPVEIFKNIFDWCFSLALLIPLAILFPFVSLGIKLTSRGPVFIKQKRLGKNGREFEILKFRSMYALAPDGSAEKNGAQWASEKDARITPLGNFLRKTRLDELPQIFNVLRGDLSFVGPRPERPEIIAELKNSVPHYQMRQLVKPGLTGWAQINFPYGASVEDATEKLQYDLYYIKNNNFSLEITIILKTVAVVLRMGGR